MTLDQWLALLSFGDVPTTDYPAIALQALTEGHESSQLAVLAGSVARERSPFELQELLELGLREVNKVAPIRAEAGRTLMRYYATQVADGALTPRAGAARIVRLATDLEDVLPSHQHAGDGLGVAQLLGLYYSHDDVAANDDAAHAEIDGALLSECRRLVTEPLQPSSGAGRDS